MVSHSQGIVSCQEIHTLKTKRPAQVARRQSMTCDTLLRLKKKTFSKRWYYKYYVQMAVKYLLGDLR